MTPFADPSDDDRSPAPAAVADTGTRPAPVALERLCLELAHGAGALVVAQRAERTGGLDVSAKSTATDLVTEVDQASERWLIAQLARLRPGDAILGEEGGGRPGTSGVRWLLDPIDGTVNFVLGIPHYAVSVAAEVAGTVQAGAVFNPVSGETFHAHRGGGGFLRDVSGARRLGGPRSIPLDRAVVGTGFGYDAELRRRQATVAAALLPRVADLRRLGSAALDLCFVAAGRLDAYFETGLHPWDHAAAGLVATEVGCRLSGRAGAAPSIELVAAAGPELAAEFFGVLAELGADDVNP